jgi:chemotaxis protein MotA
VQSTSRIDFATIAGLALGVGGIVGGLILEGGHVQEIIAPTALMIVLGGTIGAVMITTPMRALRAGVKALGKVFLEKSEAPEGMIELIVDYSSTARKSGMLRWNRSLWTRKILSCGRRSTWRWMAPIYRSSAR